MSWVRVTDIESGGRTRSGCQKRPATSRPPRCCSDRGRVYTTSGAYLLGLLSRSASGRPARSRSTCPFICPSHGTRRHHLLRELCRAATFWPSVSSPAGGGPRGHGTPGEMKLSRLATDDKGGLCSGSDWPAMISSPSTRRPKNAASWSPSPSGRPAPAPSRRARTVRHTVTSTAGIISFTTEPKTPMPRAQSVPTRAQRPSVGGAYLAACRTDARSAPTAWTASVSRSPTETGATRWVTLDYQSEGAYVRFVFSGPGGKDWGPSRHPPWTFTFEPRIGKYRDPWPGAELAGGGFTWRQYI